MHMELRKIFSAGLIVALTAAMSVGYAGDNGKRGSGFWKAFEPSVDGGENIVISLSTNPTENAEPACVAIQIGMNLLMDDLNDEDDVSVPGGEVTPVDTVILFATLDGVELLVPGNLNPNPDPDNDQLCLTKGGYKPLAGLLKKFVKVMGGEVIVCPLCWGERGYSGLPTTPPTPPTYGDIGDAFDIHNLFLYADKVISF